MIKNITIVSNNLVIDAGRLKRSQIEGWVTIYTKEGENIGGFDLLDSKLKVISKHKVNNNIYLLYTIIDREVKQ